MNRPAPPPGDAVAEVFAETFEVFAACTGSGWVRPFGAALAIVTDVPVATLNGVFALRPGVGADDIGSALGAVAGTGLPHCLEARPGCAGVAGDIAGRAGLQAHGDVPLMVATAASGPAPEGLRLRRLDPEEAALHCAVGAEGFEAPVEIFEMLASPAVLAVDGVRAYVGEVGGEAVVTALAVVRGDGVGIFDVATPARFRRRGYGAAVTAHALAEGLAAGASWGWLQSSEAGYGVYRALGFETLERWPVWVSPHA